MLRSIFLLLLLLPTLPIFAEDKPAGETKPEAKPEEKKAEPPVGNKVTEVITDQSITVRGQKLDYQARAGTISLTKPTGETRGSMFFISYTKKDAGDVKDRPVCFCFNGGPGSSSVWLHLGGYGPKRIVMPEAGTKAPKPPFALQDNEATLLEASDLVFIDPIGTGYSRAEKGEDPKQFHGYTEDVESVGDFIRLYITKYGRWGSPKFLMGESYGVVRACGLSGHLQQRYGMYLNGLILVSGLLSFNTLDADSDISHIAYLPTMTAVAFYHKKLGAEQMKDFAATTQASQEFAHGTYALALLKGDALPAPERAAIAAKLAELTGLKHDDILRWNLRIDPNAFRTRLLLEEKKVIGRFDARVIGDEGDPSFSVALGAYSGALNAYVRGELKFENDQPYEILASVGPWNYSQFTNEYLNVGSTLGGAIKQNPSLKIFVACGHYDMATPPGGIRYSLDHLGLTEELRANIRYAYYEGGHMMYTNPPEMEKLGKDTADFVQGAK